MIGEKTMKDLKRRILNQLDVEDDNYKFVEQDLDLFFDEVRKLVAELKEIK